MDMPNGSLVQRLVNLHERGGISVSIEISPPSFRADWRRLQQRITKLCTHCPLQFCAVTWHFRNFSFHNGLNDDALQLAHLLQKGNNEVLLHIAARGLSKTCLTDVLNKINSLNINNIFALRGDTTARDIHDFLYAEDLIKFVREYSTKQFDICVAGYPYGHPESQSYESDLFYLKKKINAGANFIITQIILEEENFCTFVKRCHDVGISVPILAGIMPIQDYKSFQKMIKLCHLKVPQNIKVILESIKDNAESIRTYGIFQAVMMVRTILSKRSNFGIHFFTMNRTSSLQDIMKYTGLTIPEPSKYLSFLEDAETNH